MVQKHVVYMVEYHKTCDRPPSWYDASSVALINCHRDTKPNVFKFCEIMYGHFYAVMIFVILNF